MFFKTLIASLLSAAALASPSTIGNQGANSNGVDLPQNIAINSYVPMSTHAELDMYDALKENGEKKIGSIKGADLCGNYCTYTIEDGVLNIRGTGAVEKSFSGYGDSIRKVTINEGMRSIEQGVFSDLKKLEEVKIPSSVDKIGYVAFEDCSNLQNVEYCGSAEFVDNGMFNGCGRLEVVDVPKDYLWSNFGGRNIDKALGKDECPEHFPDRCYNGEYEFNASAGILKISGDIDMCSYYYEQAYPWYRYKDNVKKIVIENDVKNIGRYAFKGYGKLEEVSILGAVEHIEDNAFEGCTNLNTVEYCSENAVTSDGNVFDGCIALEKVTVSEDYKGEKFCEKQVDKKLNENCMVSPDNGASSFRILPTTLGVMAATLAFNNHRHMN